MGTLAVLDAASMGAIGACTSLVGAGAGTPGRSTAGAAGRSGTGMDAERPGVDCGAAGIETAPMVQMRSLREGSRSPSGALTLAPPLALATVSTEALSALSPPVAPLPPPGSGTALSTQSTEMSRPPPKAPSLAPAWPPPTPMPMFPVPPPPRPVPPPPPARTRLPSACPAVPLAVATLLRVSCRIGPRTVDPLETTGGLALPSLPSFA